MTQNSVEGRLAGKVALITGAARGQGAAQARRFVAEGARVVITDMLTPEGEALAGELGSAAVWRRLDVTDEAGWRSCVAAAVETFSRLDILVNNAGIVLPGTIEDMPLSEYRKVIDVNQTGVWLGIKSVIKAMRKSGGGSIVNTASTAGLVGVKGMSAYSASKHAVRGITRTAATELGADNIRVNAIYPGAILTPMVLAAGEGIGDAMLAHQPIPRFGRAEEVANLVLFLASDEAAFCTGGEYLIDGGFLASPQLLARVPE